MIMILRDLTLSPTNLLLRTIFILWLLVSYCSADCRIMDTCPNNAAECSPYFYGDSSRYIKMFQHQNGTLKCCVAGRPRPSITWLKDGEHLNGSNRWPEHIKIRAGGKRLVIIDAVSGLDGGIYSCVASNSHSSEMFNVSVTVTVHVKDIIVLKRPENIVVYEGEDITASFNSTQAGTLRIYWKRIVHNYDPLTNETNSTLVHVDRNRTSYDSGAKRMIIHNASANDSGLYRVYLFTEYNNRTLNFTVSVISRPEETTNPIMETSIQARQTSTLNIQTNESANYSIPAFHQANQTTVPNILTSIQVKRITNSNIQTDIMSTQVIILIAICSAVFLSILITAAVCCRNYSMRKSKKLQGNMTNRIVNNYDRASGQTEQGKLKYLENMDENRYLVSVPQLIIDCRIPTASINLEQPLGAGAFGEVFKGIYFHSDQQEKISVAVKMLKEDAGITEYEELLREIKTMITIGDHPNIVKFIGCCWENNVLDLKVIMEYASLGNLKDFLRSRRPRIKHITQEISDFFSDDRVPMIWNGDMENKCSTLNTDRLVFFSLQVARGMEHLANQKVIHRDLAARNVLVADEYTVKIADFGLTREAVKSQSAQDVYIRQTQKRLPYKWMAPESLTEFYFTTKTDIWSYGVLMWEIFTYAARPHAGITLPDLVDKLILEYRLPKPKWASADIYSIMHDCWKFEPSLRPSFTDLVKKLSEIQEHLAADVNINNYV